MSTSRSATRLLISAAYRKPTSSKEYRGGSFPGMRVAPEYCAGAVRTASERVAARRSVGWDHGSHRSRIAFGEGTLTEAEILTPRILRKQSDPPRPDDPTKTAQGFR